MLGIPYVSLKVSVVQKSKKICISNNVAVPIK